MIRTETALWAAMATVLSASVASAADPRLVPSTVAKGDECDTVARKAPGDAHLSYVVHKYNPQLGASPHRLTEGQILMLPVRSPDARLERIRNQVEVQSKPGAAHQPLFGGDRVSTGDASAAEMTLSDGTVLSMGERSLVILLGTTLTGLQEDTEANLVSGSIRAQKTDLAVRPNTATRFKTRAGTVKLGPGEVRLEVDEQKAMRLAVYHGSSLVRAQGQVIKVDEGFGSKAEPGQPPTPPRPLPPAPSWKLAPAALTLARQTPADVTGDYMRGAGPGADAAEWHVQVAHDALFHEIVSDVKVPASTTHLEAKQLDLGTWFTRVSAIDDDHFEGPWGAVARMTVARFAVATGVNHIGLLDVSGPELQCGLDEQAPVPGLNVRFDRVTAHVLHCSLTGDPKTTGTVDLPAEGVGDLTLKARWLTFDPVLRQGELLLQLSDESGLPLSRSDARFSIATPGATLESYERGREAGRYFVRVRLLPDATAVGITVSLQGRTVDSNDVVLQPPPVEADESGAEVGVGGGVGIVGGSVAQVGPRFELRAAARIALGPGDIRLGVRGAIERYQGGTVAVSDPTGGPTVAGSIAHTDYGIGVPIAFRFGTPDVNVRPYLSVNPQFDAQSSRLTANARPAVDGSATWFALTPALGVELRSGPGSLFAEGGYRWAWKMTSSNAAITPRGALGTVGYLFQF